MTTAAELIEVTWTLVFGFILPGIVLAASPRAMVWFAAWVELRSTSIGYATEWRISPARIAEQEADLPDLRIASAERFGGPPRKEPSAHD